MSHTPPLERCGFIGLGSQGGPIARRMIDAGCMAALWARRPETLDPFRDAQVQFAASIEELAQACDHVGICVIDDEAVREVCQRLIPAMKPGARLVIHSTTLPDTCIEVARAAEQQGLAFVEAPVSGGGPGAQAGTLTIMAAGDVKALDAARPVFQTFASTIFHLGDVGSGQLAKLINNSLMAANLGLAHSAIAMGTARGLDGNALAELLKLSSARSFALEVYARARQGGAFTHGPTLFNKVQLLAEVVGQDDPAVEALRNAAAQMLDARQSRVNPSPAVASGAA